MSFTPVRSFVLHQPRQQTTRVEYIQAGPNDGMARRHYNAEIQERREKKVIALLSLFTLCNKVPVKREVKVTTTTTTYEVDQERHTKVSPCWLLFDLCFPSYY